MLHNLDRDLNLVTFNETEKKIYYTIAYEVHNKGKCNISDVIESSGFSRSTVYKAIKAFEDKKMVRLIQSHADRRWVQTVTTNKLYSLNDLVSLYYKAGHNRIRWFDKENIEVAHAR